MAARRPKSPRRRLLVPEVIQSSAMDCGPAALKAMLEGYGVQASYGRLREACQTSVDGTSIDTLEELAQKLGLDAEQVMVPLDHLLLPESRTFPSIAVTMLPNGSFHFVVLWRRHGRYLQVMDPTIGRRWMRATDFVNETFILEFPVPADDWREWAGSDEFLGGLTRRLDDLGISKNQGARLIEAALEDGEWPPIAALDAAVRMVAALVEAGAIGKGREARRMVESAESDSVPESYWSVRATDPDDEGRPRLTLRGAPLIRVRQRRTDSGDGEGEPSAEVSAELAAVVGDK